MHTSRNKIGTRYQGCRSEHEQGSEPRLNLPESPADEAHWRAVQSAEPATAPICQQITYNVLFCNVKKNLRVETSVADQDPGSDAFLTIGSGLGFSSVSRIPTHISEGLVPGNNFLGKIKKA
jgi:hypothetical protein